jgi:hypothetical protein
VPVAESENVARQILFDLNAFRNEDLVLDPNTHQAFIKGPVAEAAEGEAIRGSVIMSLAPWFDVGRFDYRVAIWGEHPDAAQSTAVLIKGNDGFSEALISNLLLKILLSPALSLLDFRLGHLEQGLTISVRIVIDLALLFYK